MESWLLLLVAQSVGLHLSISTDLPREEADRVLRSLQDAIATRTGRAVIVDDPLWAGCKARDPCVADVRSRIRADEVVFVEVIGGLTLVRVVASRGDREPVEADVRRDDHAADVRSIAERLFAEGRVAPIAEVVGTSTVAPIVEERSIAPWVVLGGSAVALGVGIAFGASSRSARSSSQDPNLALDDFERVADRTQSHAIVADVSFVVAAIGAVTAGVLWATE